MSDFQQFDDAILINEATAWESAKSIPDSVTRNLVMFAIAEARMRATRETRQAESEWKALLPEQPFDMQFFAAVVTSMFSKREIVRAVLDGKNLAAASGWSV